MLPLLTPGGRGIKTVEMINAMIFSAPTGETVDVPVDRAATTPSCKTDRLVAAQGKAAPTWGHRPRPSPLGFVSRGNDARPA